MELLSPKTIDIHAARSHVLIRLQIWDDFVRMMGMSRQIAKYFERREESESVTVLL